MPDYKKRTVKKVKAKKPPKTKKTAQREEILMEDSNAVRHKKQKSKPAAPVARPKKQVPKSQKTKTVPKQKSGANSKGLKVIFGGKNKKKSTFTAACIAVLILAVVLIEVLTPTGMIESIQNQYALFSASGSGLEGLQGDRFLRLQTASDSIAVLSDKYFELYNRNGKTVLYDQHGFSNPQMVHASARTLVYESGGKGLKIYNHSARLFEKTLGNNLYTATLCRNGSIAVATQSVGYASRVEVMNKNLKSVFQKDFSEDLVSAVALSEDGRYLAVSFLRASGGDFESVICGYKVSSGAKIFEHKYTAEAINCLQTLKKQQFIAVSQTQARIVGFKNGLEKTVEMERLAFIDTNLQGATVLVHAYHGNATRHNVTVVNALGEMLGTFTVDGNIKDISLGKETVSFLLDSQVKTYSFNGQETASTDCGFNTVLIAQIQQKIVSVTGKQLVFHS